MDFMVIVTVFYFSFVAGNLFSSCIKVLLSLKFIERTGMPIDGNKLMKFFITSGRRSC